MNLAVVKLGINLLSSFGVSKVLNDIVSNNTTVVTTADAILVKTGTLVLGTMIVGHASNHVNNTIDGVVAIFNKKEDNGENGTDERGTDEKDGTDISQVIPDPPPSDYDSDTRS